MIVVFCGPPGSGKGTQASVIAQWLGIPHISTGDLVRREIENGNPLGESLRPTYDRGDLIPDDVIIELLARRMDEPDASNGLLLDGFPRTLPQAEALDKMLADRNARVDAVIAFDVPDDVVAERVGKRAAIDGRSDDRPEALAERMALYRRDTLPVLHYYPSHGVPTVHVDGVGSVEEVTARIVAALESRRRTDGVLS